LNQLNIALRLADNIVAAARRDALNVRQGVSDSKGVVFVVEDDPSLRAALASLIRSVGLGVELFGSAAEFLAHARQHTLGCLLLDVRLPDVNGLDLQRTLATAGNQMPIIFMTGHGDIRTSVQAMKAGAVEFLLKPFPDEDVLEAIGHALDRERSRLLRDEEVTGIRARAASLTSRERQVMLGVVNGRLNKQVAAALGVSELTVKVHRGRVMRKMSAASFAELVRMVGRIS
jgi:FixJ family two-component response regulator